MKKINRMMINICSKDISNSKFFYTKLLDFNINFESDWFIHLISKDKQFELGIIDHNHEIIPEKFKTNPQSPTNQQGFYITFMVDNADDIYQLAKAEKMEVISKPEDTFYGQRRLLLKDPDGILVDISSMIENFKF